MSKRKLIIKNWQGGIGTLGEKKDQAGSARFVKGLNIHEDNSFITLAKATTKKSSTTVDGLVHWLEDGSPYATDRYAYDENGVIYKITSSDVFSKLRTVSNSGGEGLKVFDDFLYYALDENLGRYGKLSGTPAFDDAFIETDFASDVQLTGGGTGAADYVPPTSISETATNRQTFTPTIDPIKSIVINVDVVGTGDWTLTVHDAQNNSIGAVTTVNGSMAVGDNTFTFSSPIRVVRNNAYHFHITSTVADGGVDTETATDLEGAEFTINHGVLITATFHPMVVVEDLLIIGNDRYLATWDQSTYSPNKITLDVGFQVRAIARFEEFIVAAAFKGASVDEAEESRLYFWDTIGPSFNFSSPLTIGVPEAIHNSRGNLIGVYGTAGSIFRGNDPFEQVTHEAPKLARGKKVEVFPGAITEYEGRTLVGMGANTDDTSSFEVGVYEFGSQATILPQVLNMPYVISTGNTSGSNVKIGCVKSVGNDLYISWSDDT